MPKEITQPLARRSQLQTAGGLFKNCNEGKNLRLTNDKKIYYQEGGKIKKIATNLFSQHNWKEEEGKQWNVSWSSSSFLLCLLTGLVKMVLEIGWMQVMNYDRHQWNILFLFHLAHCFLDFDGKFEEWSPFHSSDSQSVSDIPGHEVEQTIRRKDV